MANDQLALDRETMRRLGYRTVDMLVERLAAPPGDVVRRATPAEMRERLDAPPPEQGADYEQILGDLERDVLPFMARCGHPGYFAFIPGEGTFPGALGDFIASALNVDACWWMGGAGPSQVELVVLDWFKRWLGFPSTASGVLVSGGSAANMTALACARERLIGSMADDCVAYVGDQGHSSIARAARVLGFRPDQVRVLPSDELMRTRPDALAGAMDADLRAGRRPLFVAANAGSTNSGAVDELARIAEVCHERGAWLHVDGAYGGFAALTERGRSALEGIELADSITLDPHKWLYQPFECGALLVREGPSLREAFEITPDYLRDVEVLSQEVNFSDLGVQLTRSARAFKLWISLRYFGVAAFRGAIDRSLDLALAAEAQVAAAPELELMTPASLGIVTFRRRPPGIDDEDQLEQLNADLVAELEDSGLGFVSSTRLRGRYAIRLCVLNHSSGPADVERVIRFLATTHVPASRPPLPRVEHDRNPDIETGWLRRPRLDTSTLRELPLFATLDERAAEHVLHAAREVTVAAGTAIIEQWEGSRDFYVVLDGAVRMERDGELMAALAPGQYFGEIAALDWGASFGRTRLASVVAMTSTRLLVLEWQVLNALVRDEPAVGEEIRRTVRDRLAMLAT